MNDVKIKKFILKELSHFQFNRYSKGFRYLCEAIILCINEETAINNLHKNVFPKIVEKYNEHSPLNVKWCIDYSIRTMYDNTDLNILSNYFGVPINIKPSLKFIVYTIVSKYELKYKST